MIITNVQGLRDPFVLVENGVYYLYGTGKYGTDWDKTVWACYVNDSGDLQGEWKRTEHLVYETPAHAVRQFWAPEVHKYKGKYYMICSYFSAETGHRGSTVLKADSPTGPFVEISDGHITPHDRDCIDATLYVDEKGQPWLVFVDEWTDTEDGVGRMDAAKLSEDLTRLISEPVELFRADDPVWAQWKITDGCFMRTLQSGELIMLWSNFDANGYCIAVAHAKEGKADGAWEHEEKPFFTKGMKDHHDGGHAMIFTALDGKQYVSCHSPNRPCDECHERTVFIPVEERDGALRMVEE